MAQPAFEQPKPSRLARVKRGRIKAPIRCLLYGVEKIGKSTFASEAPSPVFLCSEDGTNELDVARLPQPETWLDVLDSIRELTTEAHDFQTLAVDTLDWLEPILWRFICDRDGKSDIEDYGYGKGYTAALAEWRVLLAALDRLREKRGMHIVLLAHSWIRPFKNPTGDDYDRYELKVHLKAGGLVKEWAEAVLFAQHETFVVKRKETDRARAVDNGARVIHTQRRAAWDAGNRYGLPEKLPLSWSDFWEAVQAGSPASLETMLAEIRELIDRVDVATAHAAQHWLEKPTNVADRTKLALMADRLRAKAQDNQSTKEESHQ